MLVRRGWALLRDQRKVIQHAVDQGCRAVTPDEAYVEISRLLERESAGG
jgi:uridine kinase